VCAAHDEAAGEAVAIKKISNAFEHATYTKRTLREIRLLRLLQHDNVIRLRTLLPPVKSDGFKDLCKAEPGILLFRRSLDARRGGAERIRLVQE